MTQRKTPAKSTKPKVSTKNPKTKSKSTSQTATAAKNNGSSKTSSKKAPSGNGLVKVTQEERRKMIAEAAYYNSLNGGDEVSNWLKAEADIDRRVTV